MERKEEGVLKLGLMVVCSYRRLGGGMGHCIRFLIERIVGGGGFQIVRVSRVVDVDPDQ